MRRLIGSAATLVLSISAVALAQAPRSPLDRFAKPSPFTIRGNALNHEGKPVAGATVYVYCTNRIRQGNVDEVVAKAMTDETGVYVMRDVPLPILAPDGGPIKKYSEGAFQVFATAPGYGFTWRPEQFVRPEKRPADANAGPNLSYLGEDCIADLAFDLPATVQGRLTNDRGQPLAGVKVEIGYVHNVRRPGGYGFSSCAYLGPPNVPGDPPDDHFSGIDHLPEEFRTAVTDKDGRYKITGLRRDTVYGVLIDYRPEVDPLDISLALTTSNKGRAERRLGYDAQLDHVFIEPPTVNVLIAGTDGVALPNITVRARRKQLLRAGNLAKSDATGKAVLHLPADSYTLIAEPPIGTPYLPREADLVVSGDPREQTLNVSLEPAATIVLTAAEAETNKPLAGVSFFQESGSGNDRRELQSQTVVADYPATDDRAELRAILPPGSLRLVIDKPPPGYEPVRAASELLTLSAGQTQTIHFEFRKSATAEPAVPQDELSALRELLAKQKNLPKSGTYVIRQATTFPVTMSAEELRNLVKSWDPAAADFFDILQQHVPKGSFRDSRTKVITQGDRQRNETEVELTGMPSGTRISVSNGHENVVLDPANGQCSLSPTIVGTTPQRFAPTPSTFYPLPSIAYAYANRPGVPQPHATHQDGKLKLERGSPPTSREVVDEETGFLHHSWSGAPNGVGRESWYLSPRRMPGGQILASVVIECQFNGDKLSMLRVLKLEDAKIEAPPSDAFVVSAPAGTNIFDFRLDRQHPKSELVNYPVADVVMVANRISVDNRSILPVLKIGQAAPPLDPVAWLNAAGQTAPPEQKGKVVLIDFWGIYCGPCLAELPDVQTLSIEFAKDNFLLIGLHESNTDVAELAEFARKRSLTYQLAIDRPAEGSLGFGAAFKAYGIQGIPNCAVIDQQGRIAYVGRFQEAALKAAKLLGKDNK
jgi:thiol-disulfide isomerase/thioredoxin/protocatechuate 3,4-dioxygenase beta subunit